MMMIAALKKMIAVHECIHGRQKQHNYFTISMRSELRIKVQYIPPGQVVDGGGVG